MAYPSRSGIPIRIVDSQPAPGKRSDAYFAGGHPSWHAAPDRTGGFGSTVGWNWRGPSDTTAAEDSGGLFWPADTSEMRATLDDRWKYSVADGELIVSRWEDPGAPIWRGRIDNCRIQTIVVLPISGDCIALLDYSAGPRSGAFANVVRFAYQQGIAWRASPPGLGTPDGFDAYVALSLQGEALEAYSWSGHRVILDPQDGRVTATEFTK